MKYAIRAMLMFSILFAQIYASPVDAHIAERAAASRLHRDSRSFSYTITNSTVLEHSQNQIPIAHVFELDPTGYIITAADTDLPPVIAYSYTDNCRFGGEDEGILLKIVRRDIELRLSFVDMTPDEQLDMHRALWTKYTSGNLELLSDQLLEQWPPAGSTPTGGWLAENWTQGAPYNTYCPLDLTAGSRSVAGCPAVAMGMILNFAETTNGTQFSDTDDYYHNYNEYYWIDDDHVTHDFPSWPELNVYLDTLEYHYANHETITNSDKAALVYSCGAACKQVYTASVSGTFGVDQAFNAYLKFSFNDCSLMYASSDSLFEKLSENMMNAMPAHLAVLDSVPQYGHNLVVDGYNTDDFYHLNFGWGGSYNGWYQFPLSGMPYSMNIIEGIILDIGEGQQSIEDDVLRDGTSVLTLSFPANPVSDCLEIVLQVTQNCIADVSIYNITGHRIAMVACGEFGPGSHELYWVPGDTETGIYILSVSGPWGSESARFTLLH